MDKLKEKYGKKSLHGESSEAEVGYFDSQSTEFVNDLKHISSSEEESKYLKRNLSESQSILQKKDKIIFDLENNVRNLEEGVRNLQEKLDIANRMNMEQNKEVLELRENNLNSAELLKDKQEQVLRLQRSLQTAGENSNKQVEKFKSQWKTSKERLAQKNEDICNLLRRNEELEERLHKSVANEFTDELQKEMEMYKMLSESMKEDLSFESAEKDSAGFKLKALAENISNEKQALKEEFKSFDESLQDFFNGTTAYYSNVLAAIPEEYRDVVK